MNQIEQFLSNFPHLKQLVLILRGTTDLIDDYRWEKLTSSMTIFNFKFDLDSNFPSLDSFRTLFWQKEKHWYIDSQNTSVFSVPYFSPVHIDIDTRSHRQSAILMHEFTVKKLNSMNIISMPKVQLLYYPYIKNLSINCSFSLANIQHLVDLKQIKYLSILSINDLLKFQPYKLIIPNIYELKIRNSVTFDNIEQIKDYQFEKIQKLNISINNNDTDLILKRLFFCFLHIEYLIYLSPIDSIERLIQIIDGFTHLLNATFDSGHFFFSMTMFPYPRFNFITQYSQRFKENNFTYRLQRMPSHSIGTHWWFAPQVNVNYTIKILSIFIFLFSVAITIIFDIIEFTVYLALDKTSFCFGLTAHNDLKNCVYREFMKTKFDCI